MVAINERCNVDVPALIEQSASSEQDDSSSDEDDSGDDDDSKSICADKEDGEVLPRLIEMSASSEEDDSSSCDDDSGAEDDSDVVHGSKGCDEEEVPALIEVLSSSEEVESSSEEDDSSDEEEGVDDALKRIEKVKKLTEGRAQNVKKKIIRVPTVKERKEARANNQVCAYGVRSAVGAMVVLQRQVAQAKAARNGYCQLFDKYANLVRNIKAAKEWAVAHDVEWNREATPYIPADSQCAVRIKESGADLQYDSQGEQMKQETHQCQKCNMSTLQYDAEVAEPKECSTISGEDSGKRLKSIVWNCGAASFEPTGKEDARVEAAERIQERTRVSEKGPTLAKERCAESFRTEVKLNLRDLLQHPQVSNVRPVRSKVRAKMGTFVQCGQDEWTLDLRGTTAKQIQRRLREQLVEDLKQGSDEAAFVCSQLGIDLVPRADQLELMIAAMPGVAKLVLEGTTAKSGLDLAAWKELHATHCCKGCTKDKIDDECYFHIVFHFLRCGFDPKLKEGCSWDDFKKQFPAYVDMWRNDEERCRAAWKKWVGSTEGLLSEPVTTEPTFAVPVLPATRSKHKWRYIKYGIPYKVRLCLDLKASGVNWASEDWKFRYKALDDIAADVQQGDWLASVDISRFYLRLPAGPNLRKVQWVQDPESYAHTTKLNNKSKRKLWRQLNAIGFGLKTAPAWASVVSAELARILKAEGIRVVGCFLDDLLIAGKDEKECKKAWKRAIEIMARLGIPANDKLVPPKSPTEGIVFLGIHIRTADLRFTVSEEHREYAMDRVKTVLEEGVATKADMSSIAGVLNWISFVFIPGRPRRQIIYDAARLGSSGSKTDKVVIEGALQRQLQWWKNSLQVKNFVGSRIWTKHTAPRAMLIRSDASGEDGWGVCMAGFHFVVPWPEDVQDEHMLFKEMLPIVIAISVLSKQLPETVFGVAVDNTGVAFAVNKLSCRDRITLRLLQQLASDLDEGGHTVLGAHIRRHRNEHTDEMSHALPKFEWNRITKHQLHGKRVTEGAYWLFPFVAQQLSTGECLSGCFKMRKSLFARMSDASTLNPIGVRGS